MYLTYDKLLSKFAINLKLRPCTTVGLPVPVEVALGMSIPAVVGPCSFTLLACFEGPRTDPAWCQRVNL